MGAIIVAAMFCGMNFTTTGIEFGRSEPSIVRVVSHKVLTVPLPATEKQSAGQGLARKAVQPQEGSQSVSRLETSRAGQDSQKNTRNGVFVEDPSPSPYSSLGSPYPLRPFPSPLSSTRPDHRSAKASKAKMYATPNARSSVPSSSSLPLGIDSGFSQQHKSSMGKASLKVQSMPEKSSSLEISRPNGGFSDAKLVRTKTIKGAPKKRVRFAMNAQENHMSQRPDPSKEASSSDDSDCSYIDPPPMAYLERARLRPSKPSNTLRQRSFRVAPATTGHRSSRYSADSPVAGAFRRSKGQSMASKGHARVRPLDPIIAVCPDQEKGEGRDTFSQPPTVIKSILKNTSAEHQATPSDDDKENNLQYDERSGLAFRDV